MECAIPFADWRLSNLRVDMATRDHLSPSTQYLNISTIIVVGEHASNLSQRIANHIATRFHHSPTEFIVRQANSEFGDYIIVCPSSDLRNCKNYSIYIHIHLYPYLKKFYG
jgi:hypothetical protein